MPKINNNTKVNSRTRRDELNPKSYDLKSSQGVFKMLNHRYNYPRPGEGIRIKSRYFANQSVIGTKARDSASLAMESIASSRGTLDCETSVLISFLYEIKNKIGDEAFNNRFRPDTKTCLNIRVGQFKIQPAFQDFLDVVECNINELKEGDWVYLARDNATIQTRDRRIGRGQHVRISSLHVYNITKDHRDIKMFGFLPGQYIRDGLSFNTWNRMCFNGQLKDFLHTHQGKIRVIRFKPAFDY